MRHVIANVPGITPTPPPGLNGLTTILSWVAWLVLFGCIIGFFFSAGRIGMAMRNGEELEGFKGAVLACIASVIVGGATLIFTAVTGMSIVS